MKRAYFLKKLAFGGSVFDAYRRLKSNNPSVLLESARSSGKIGRYSFICTGPQSVIRTHGQDPFLALARAVGPTTPAPEGFPPFLGGAIGYLSYECKNYVEPALSRRAKDDLGLPEACFFVCDRGVIFDHESGTSHAFFTAPSSPKTQKAVGTEASKALSGIARRLAISKRKKKSRVVKIAPHEIASSMDKKAFIAAVLAAKKSIRAGDVFQVNLAQRLEFKLTEDPLDVYARLRKLNPSPFFGIFDAGDFSLVSGSPERLLKLENGVLETRPIAGTRSRGRNAVEDSAVSTELILNEKERAEHVMLVDLERNDLGRVAEYGSVAVDEFMAIENYSHVKHIVSNVRAVLKKGARPVDALRAFFPGGTITGTPKVSCMRIIDELEPVARGPYTGSLGYLSFTGNMDFNIMIRSLVVRRGRAYLHVGAGIVADSQPEKEYDETLYKAQAVLTAVFGERRARSYIRSRRA